MDLQKFIANLEKKQYTVRHFATGKEAADYLDAAIDGTSVAFGGSVSVKQLQLDERLASHNEVVSHSRLKEGETPEECMQRAMNTEIYICSVNGAAESGELVNIDGTGNRVASTLFGHKKVYFIIGRNKLAADLEGAIWRARNISAPKNAQRLQRRTPCAAKGDRCYDCDSPERICKGLVVHYEKIRSMEMEVVLVDEELGY